MMRVRYWLPLAFTLVGTSCETTTVEVAAAAMISHVDGDVGLDLPSASGASLGNLKLGASELGIDDTELRPYLRGDIRTGSFNVGVSALYHDDDSTTTLTRPFGQIAAGRSVNAELQLINVKTIASYDIIDTGFLRLAPAILFDVISLDVEARDIGASPAVFLEEVTNLLYAPMPAAVAEVNFGKFGAEVEFGGINADFGDGSGTIVDLAAKVRATPFERFDAWLGFRYIKTDVLGRADGSPFDADLDFFGYFLGGSYTF
ncbi:MAG: hypothetical protein AAF628_28280 [Planctomycetota bacterium]